MSFYRVQTREVPRISASQVETFRRCKRLWYLEKPCGVKSPASKGQSLGSVVHKALEEYLQGFGIRNIDLRPMLAPALKILPAPGQDLLLEHEIRLPTYPEGPDLIGFIDLVNPRELANGVLLIDDHKTRGDFKYAPSEEELKINLQAIVYSRWGYLIPELAHAVPEAPPWSLAAGGIKLVKFAHNNISTKAPKAMRVSADMDRTRVNTGWDALVEDAREMVKLAATGPEEPCDVEGTRSSCDAYGGCFFKKNGTCSDVLVPVRPFLTLSRRTDMSDVKKPSLMERLAARKGGALPTAALATPSDTVITAPAEPTRPSEINQSETRPAGNGQVYERIAGEQSWTLRPAAPGEPSTPPSTIAQGVVAPDAPSREQSPEDAAAAEKPKRGRKKSAAPTAPLTETIAAAPVSAPADNEGLKMHAAVNTHVILVDCLPTETAPFAKLFGAEPTSAERWLEPIRQFVAKELGEPDPAMADFGKGAAGVAATIGQQIDTLPQVVTLSSYSRYSHLLLEAAHARGWVVIRSMKG